MGAESKLWISAFTIEQNLLCMYHHNSYSNNSAMLRSPKPLMMRDVFLTKTTATFPNPLSTLYVPRWSDMFVGTAAAMVFGHALIPVLGWGTLTATYFFGGFMSSAAFIFQSQLSPQRLNSRYDVNAASLGGWSAIAALSFYCGPLARFYWGTPRPKAGYDIRPAALLYIAYALADEYVWPRFIDKHPEMKEYEEDSSMLLHNTSAPVFQQAQMPPKDLNTPAPVDPKALRDALEVRSDSPKMAALAELGIPMDRTVMSPPPVLTPKPKVRKERPAVVHNWGSIGGIFGGLMVGSLIVRRRMDAASMKKIYDTIMNNTR